MYKIYEEDGKVIVEDSNGSIKTITIGNAVIFTAETVAFAFAGIYVPKFPVEARIKAFTEAGDIFGCSATKFAHMLRGALYRVYVRPYKHVLNRIAYNSKGLNTQIYTKVVNNWGMITQYIADGNEHLATFGALSGTAEESKKVFGKGLWKKLCHNTKSRNDLIVKVALSLWNGTPDFRLIRELNKIPSTLLKGTTFPPLIITNDCIFEYATPLLAKYKTCKAITRAVLTYTHNIITDTIRMLDGNINVNWSINTWDRRHKELAEVRNQALLGSKEIFEATGKYPKTIDGGNFFATLLDSEYAIKQEGKAQHHCCGIYSDFVKRGEYVIYSIKGLNDEVSTLGIPLISGLNLQHFMACNRTVEDEDRVAFANLIIKNISNTLSATAALI